MTTVFSRAHRILKPLSDYRDFKENETWATEILVRPELSESEEPVGVYLNDPLTFLDTIFFSSRALYLFRSGVWARLKYSEIEKINTPAEMISVFELTISRRDGQKFVLPVRGGRGGRFSDAFEVLRFLDRVKLQSSALI